MTTLRPLLARYARRPGLVAVLLASMAYQAAFNMALSIAGRVVFDQVLPRHDASLLATVMGTMAVALVVRVGAATLQERTASRLAVHVVTSFRAELFERLHDLSPGYFAGRSAGDTLARFSGDLGVVEGAASRLVPRATYGLLNALGCCALMLALDWRLAALIFVALLLTLVMPRRLAGRTARANAARRSFEAGLLADVQENVAMHSVVRLFALQRWARDRHQRRVAELGTVAERAFFVAGMVEWATVLAFCAVQLLVLGGGAYLAITRGLSVGVLVAFTSLVATVAANILGLSQVVPALIESGAGMERVTEFLDAEADSRSRAPTERLPRLSRSVRFEDLSFSYTGERKDLDRVSLEIEAGTSVALVGPSGSGKSTLLALLMRQHRPTSGSLRVDDHEVAATSPVSLFEQMAVVPQESLLFDMTVRENIRLGRLDASDAEVELAARQAEVHDGILQMPQGYDTRAGERGSQLSGGQRQRIAIARAILRNPALLLLDEATSALDAATEAAITRTLVTLRKGRTVVSVTHRLASVTDYDHLAVMHEGRLVQLGTHERLLAEDGVYRDLWEKQHSVRVSDDGAESHVEPRYLARVPLFAGMNAAELTEIAERFSTMRFTDDHVLFRAGDPGDAFYVVARGTVEVDVPHGPSTRIRRCTEGDFFGEIALLGDRPRTATVRVVGSTTLLVLARQSFQHLMAERPHIREALERVAADHLQADVA